MFGRIALAIIALIVVAGAAWAIWPRPTTVETAAVERGSFEVLVEEEGKSRIREVFTVSTPITGKMQRLILHSGDSVVADETVVATIRPAGPGLLDERSRRIAEATAQVAQAAVELASAQVLQAERQVGFTEQALERTISLSQRGLVAEQALDKARLDADIAVTTLQSAQAGLIVRQRELDSAEAALIEGVGNDDPQTCCIEVRAPVSGRILQVLTESEQVVQAGTPLLTIGDPADIEIAVELLSRDAVRLQPGAEATIDGWGGSPLSARLTRIEPVATTKISALGIEEQRAMAILELQPPSDQWQRLGHGFRVVAHIVRWRGEDLLTVPIGALFRLDGNWAAYVVEGGKAVARQIEIGERNGQVAEVVAGLKPGEQVILHPADTITSGTAVVPLQVSGAVL